LCSFDGTRRHAGWRSIGIEEGEGNCRACDCWAPGLLAPRDGRPRIAERERERERELNAPRRTLELKLAEVVVALREHCPDGNITLRVLETGDIVAILKVDDDEAADLAKLLGQH